MDRKLPEEDGKENFDGLMQVEQKRLFKKINTTGIDIMKRETFCGVCFSVVFAKIRSF